MGVFHLFKIVQMVPNRATHHLCETPVNESFKPISRHWSLSVLPENQSFSDIFKETSGIIKRAMSLNFKFHLQSYITLYQCYLRSKSAVRKCEFYSISWHKKSQIFKLPEGKYMFKVTIWQNRIDVMTIAVNVLPLLGKTEFS